MIWIRTQDSKDIYLASSFWTEVKKSKDITEGCYIYGGTVHEDRICFGRYDNIKEAEEIMSEIYQSIKLGEKAYYMPLSKSDIEKKIKEGKE